MTEIAEIRLITFTDFFEISTVALCKMQSFNYFQAFTINPVPEE
jgi:hypothetical protein